MELKLNNFSNKQDYYEQIGQTLNNWAQSLIRPIDYAVEHTTQAFASATSSTTYKIAVASMHTLVLPCTLTLYAMGTAVDQIGDFLKTRTYNYLPGKAQEKTPTPRTPFSLLSANLCMLPYGIATWAGMSPAQQRIDALAQKILQTNADFICLQEMAPDHANALWNKIHKHYAHGFSRIGPMPSNRMNGGLFFASKYPVEKTLYHPLPNTGPIARGIFCVKTHIGWILIGHLKAGDDDSDVILRKEQVSSIQKLCEKLSDNGTIPCLIAMDSNIKRTGKKNDEYELSGIPKYFYNSYTSSEPFSLTRENATCTNVPSLALQGKQPKTLEDAYEHIDYILSYKASANFLSVKTKQIPTYSLPNTSPLSDHKILFAEGSYIPLAKPLQTISDILQYLIPVSCGAARILQGHYVDGAVFALAGLTHQIGFPYLKKCFPNSLRPNGKKGSCPSGHTSAAFLGVSFLLARGGLSPLLVTVTALASLTAFSRWYTRHHFPKDLLAGAISGTILGITASVISSRIST